MLQYFETLTDDSGNSLLGATVTVTNYPSGTLASIFNTNGTASPVANSTVVADITGQVSFYAPDGAYTLTYAFKSTVYKTKSPVQMLDPMGFVTAPDTGAANAYVLTDPRFPASLYAGLKSTFTALNANTGASTYNLNATGNQPLRQVDGSALSAGLIAAGGIYQVQWTGAAWQLLNDIIFSATIIGGLIYPVTAAETAAAVVPSNFAYANVGQENADVRRYGAVGDGVTSDTNAFQSAVSILANGVINAMRTTASWLVGAVSLALPAIFQGGGKITLSGANAGFKLNANMTGGAFKDIEVVGDRNIGNLHRMVWNDGTKTLSGLHISGVYVHDCIQNIDVSQMTDSTIIGNRIDTAAPIGGAAGQGYGVVSSHSKRIAHVGNTLVGNGRHSIYSSSVTYNALVGNISYQNAGAGSASAFPVTRLATGMSLVGNIIAEAIGTGMSIDADNADGNGTCRAIQVIGNVFFQAPGSANVNADLAIGSSVPATNPLQTISVRNNSFTSSPVRQNGFIVVTNGLNLDISDNIFDCYLGTVAGQFGINLDATGGSAFYDRIRVCGNTGVIASSGGATTFLNVGANICTGTTQLDIFNNTLTAGALISYAVTPTNPNIRTDWLQEQVIVLAAGAQNMNIAGYNRFTITGNGGGSSVTNITNGYEGKIITLEFNDANTTLARGNQVLSGSANFVSVNRAIMVLQLRGANWYEISRSLDG